MMLRVHILSKKLTYIKLKIVLCSLQDIHEFLDLSPQPPTLVQLVKFLGNMQMNGTIRLISFFFKSRIGS